MRHLRSNASVLLLAAMTTIVSLGSAEARGERVLHSFTDTDGVLPSSGLVVDANGNMYGTTSFGGPRNAGTVFRVAPNGDERILYSFLGGSDGVDPTGGVVMDAKGNLYGTTNSGGAHNAGTVFKLTPRGKKTVLYSFGGYAGDGHYPESSLILDTKGNLYGTTDNGGVADSGTVFKVTPKGTEAVLYSFMGGSDGYLPQGGVIMDANGNLYGTTGLGGEGNLGMVFKLAPGGEKTVLHSFTGDGDANNPAASLIMDDGGNLYGTGQLGGSKGVGAVFKLTADGKESVLYSFAGGNDGINPACSLITDAGGNLYGTTAAGGPNGSGIVFRLTAAGKEKVLYAFTGGNDGAGPQYGLIMDARSSLYGTTGYGGKAQDGVVFKLGN